MRVADYDGRRAVVGAVSAAGQALAVPRLAGGCAMAAALSAVRHQFRCIRRAYCRSPHHKSHHLWCVATSAPLSRVCTQGGIMCSHGNVVFALSHQCTNESVHLGKLEISATWAGCSIRQTCIMYNCRCMRGLFQCQTCFLLSDLENV